MLVVGANRGAGMPRESTGSQQIALNVEPVGMDHIYRSHNAVRQKGRRMRTLPPHLETVREKARRAIAPVEPAPEGAQTTLTFPFSGERTNAGRQLPPYYLVYFLLVDLLGFRDLGQFEKVAWSVPVDFEGRVYLIEHRKMGLGVFSESAQAGESDAAKIVAAIKAGVSAAQPFFNWLAEEAVKASEINVKNNSGWLFERYQYLRKHFRRAAALAVRRKADRKVIKRTTARGTTVTRVHIPWYQLRKRANWMAIATMDAFFSWTEHVFIHLAILNGSIKTGSQVAALIDEDWPTKFKTAIGLGDAITRDLYEKLLVIRRQHRNYIAHGAFGKKGEAFSFHSGTGAVPVMLSDRGDHGQFALSAELDTADDGAIETMDEFVKHLWDGARAPAGIYIQDAELPSILTFADNGAYAEAMQSVANMKELVDWVIRQMDDAANMDW